MKLERLQELINERPGLSIEDGEVVHVYEFNGQKKKVTISVEFLLTDPAAMSPVEEESVISEFLDGLLRSKEYDQRAQDADDMQKMLKLASRYVYLRDVVLKDSKRGELPDMLREYFYEVEDIKYPKSDDYDRAIDKLMERGAV